MHIPDGYIGPWTLCGYWAGMVSIWAWVSKRLAKVGSLYRIPTVAVASVYSFIVMVVAIPLPGGTTGHLVGAGLAGILLGPSSGVAAVSVAIFIQALFLGEGGLLALPVNCFNMAVLGTITGFLVFKVFNKGVLLKMGLAEKKWILFAPAFVAGYASSVVSSIGFAIVLGIQPLIQHGYFLYSLRVTIPAIVIPHVGIFGVLEGIMTGLICVFVQMKNTRGFLKMTEQ